ncbi:hypothetical protein pah_c197o099 [Parachlamydia acanthamoebae str. Hall's coccus]|nr:hypothetical protein pah_c197o099 [Parachlamydia acanthamoebae str. Hall's coccus]
MPNGSDCPVCPECPVCPPETLEDNITTSFLFGGDFSGK